MFRFVEFFLGQLSGLLRFELRLTRCSLFSTLTHFHFYAAHLPRWRPPCSISEDWCFKPLVLETHHDHRCLSITFNKKEKKNSTFMRCHLYLLSNFSSNYLPTWKKQQIEELLSSMWLRWTPTLCALSLSATYLSTFRPFFLHFFYSCSISAWEEK